eukprot:RCo050839
MRAMKVCVVKNTRDPRQPTKAEEPGCKENIHKMYKGRVFRAEPIEDSSLSLKGKEKTLNKQHEKVATPPPLEDEAGGGGGRTAILGVGKGMATHIRWKRESGCRPSYPPSRKLAGPLSSNLELSVRRKGCRFAAAVNSSILRCFLSFAANSAKSSLTQESIWTSMSCGWSISAGPTDTERVSHPSCSDAEDEPRSLLMQNNSSSSSSRLRYLRAQPISCFEIRLSLFLSNIEKASSVFAPRCPCWDSSRRASTNSPKLTRPFLFRSRAGKRNRRESISAWEIPAFTQPLIIFFKVRLLRFFPPDICR